MFYSLSREKQQLRIELPFVKLFTWAFILDLRRKKLSNNIELFFLIGKKVDIMTLQHMFALPLPKFPNMDRIINLKKYLRMRSKTGHVHVTVT